MTTSTHATGAVSTPAPDKCSVDFFWRDFLTALFPSNTAASVASFTRTSVRAAERVLSGRNNLGGPALVNLLRSPVGSQVLDALAGDVEWRVVERRLIEIKELENELQSLEQKRRELTRDLDARR
jgi:hypothetical protein